MAVIWPSLLFLTLVSAKYTADWDSLDARPIPQWYDEAKFGIFCHWGVYSVPAYRSEWFWWYWKGTQPDVNVVSYMEKNYKPGTTYADFAKDFTAELFDPKEFVDTVQASGAKYFVLTSKHHEGFTMWPSRTSWNWNSLDIGPKRDIVGDLKDAFKTTNVRYGLYFSQFEWFNPLFIEDGHHNTSLYSKLISYPQMLEIVSKYRPEIVWSDGEWDKTDEYWRSREFLAWLYNSSPVKESVVVNDRWGAGTIGKHGGFFTYSDHYDPGKLLARKWENCMTLDKNSWGNRRTMKSEDVHTVYELISQIARTVSCNGNVLLNIGPDMHGRIPPIFEDRLREMGKFLDLQQTFGTLQKYRDRKHHQGLYNAQLQKQTIIYAWVLNTNFDVLELDCVKLTKQTKVTFMSTDRSIIPGQPGSALRISHGDVPWRDLLRRDVFILKIEYAAGETRDPLNP
ncbi:unnamed protein product [Caenorhabditis auriculariae]|uniref:Putative alpha-L-fucosidase n=1 Tax=Caenorhabditis auriculariae TaxID=2777116 RepID=A0A8S1H568_9PELO|nr:unnamed protein product [Caenorhabditis auriculariae]